MSLAHCAVPKNHPNVVLAELYPALELYTTREPSRVLSGLLASLRDEFGSCPHVSSEEDYVGEGRSFGRLLIVECHTSPGRRDPSPYVSIAVLEFFLAREYTGNRRDELTAREALWVYGRARAGDLTLADEIIQRHLLLRSAATA